jgi:hypothetical protein
MVYLMDPVSVSIVTALSAGTIAAAKDVATRAVKDAYSALKKLVIDRYKKSGPFVEALESNPGSQAEQEVLANQLHGVDSDPDAKVLAAKLLDALEALERDPKAQAVFDFEKVRAAKKFELNDIEFSGTLLRAKDAVFEDDFKATDLRQKGAAGKPGN